MRAWSRPSVPRLPQEGSQERVRAWDTARRSVVPVGPETGTARLYVCGITPYDATHLGHANTYLTFDLLQRAWLDAGLQVRYAQNVTDVDDPLLERAQQTGEDWEELAEQQTELFREDMTALRILPPDAFVGAVEAIGDVVALTHRLQQTGTIYAVDDPAHPDLYFRCEEAPGFGSVSHLDREAMVAEFADHGGDPDRPGKRDALDALIWRQERDDEPSWPTDLGQGRPGWHVECTAIALRELGDQIDVQGGGRDLAFPHHEMCAAEGVVATGRPFADAYLHSGMVALDGEKMSKSKGNLVFVSKLRREGVDPMAIRLALLGHHWREDWEWFEGDLEQATRRLQVWRDAVARPSGPDGVQALAELRAALREDLDAPGVLAAVDRWAESDGDDGRAPRLMADAIDALLGVLLVDAER